MYVVKNYLESLKLTFLYVYMVDGAVQVYTNATLTQFDSCRYQAVVKCSLPIFPLLRSVPTTSSYGADTLLEQVLLPRLTASVVIIRTSTAPNPVIISPSTTLAPAVPSSNLALILGLSIPGGLLLIALIFYGWWRYRENRRTDQITSLVEYPGTESVG